MPRSAIIWTRSRELSLNVRYHRMHRTMISWSKCRPLKRSCAEVGSVIPAVIARHRAFQQFAPEPAHRTKDHSHARALRCLGQRWLKIIHKMWMDRTPYNAELHHLNQVKHGSWVFQLKTVNCK